jgi:transposase
VSLTIFSQMSLTVSPQVETTGEAKQLTPKQRQVALLIAQGYSQEAAVREVAISIRTFHRWRQEPAFRAALESLKAEFISRYERSFTSMLPEVALKHRQLLHSQSEAIAMRAVDSAHTNHVRCVREQETKSEVEELKEMVKQLLEQLAQERAAG